jgi:hypothetical protein
MMDPWRDYPKFTDAALDYFIRGFPSHPDHAAAVAEFERRRKERDQRVESGSENAIPVGGRFFIWAIAGFVILALIILFLALSILTHRTHREPRPISFSEPPTPFRNCCLPRKGSTLHALSLKPSATDTPAPL